MNVIGRAGEHVREVSHPEMSRLDAVEDQQAGCSVQDESATCARALIGLCANDSVAFTESKQ